MPTTTETARIAAAANILRPDWPTASVQSYLDLRHAHRPYQDLAAAVAYIACDPDTRTPKRLEQDGPWWRVGVNAQRDPARAAPPIGEVWREHARHGIPATDEQRRSALETARRAITTEAR